MPIMCAQAALHLHKNMCMLIPLCKNNNNLNLPMSYFFLPYAWLPPPLVHVVTLGTSLDCTDFFRLFLQKATL